ncbi:hypothetical protein [Thiomonas sp. FB-6]|uniref:hypothetical protein n=1 Tax=Thiomonas sp. FB-6 TaxID=1158291 RepID=UPI000361896D
MEQRRIEEQRIALAQRQLHEMRLEIVAHFGSRMIDSNTAVASSMGAVSAKAWRSTMAPAPSRSTATHSDCSSRHRSASAIQRLDASPSPCFRNPPA